MRIRVSFVTATMVLAGCASTQPAAINRQSAVDPVAFAQRPVCFLPPPPNLGPIAMKNAQDTLKLCELAAHEEHVNVAPFGTPGCAVASLSFSASRTGEFEATCAPSGWGERTCTGADVQHKMAKVIISEQPGGPPLIETLAALRSTAPSFSDNTFLALCRIAFHQYPQPMNNYQYDAEVGEISH